MWNTYERESNCIETHVRCFQSQRLSHVHVDHLSRTHTFRNDLKLSMSPDKTHFKKYILWTVLQTISNSKASTSTMKESPATEHGSERNKTSKRMKNTPSMPSVTSVSLQEHVLVDSLLESKSQQSWSRWSLPMIWSATSAHKIFTSSETQHSNPVPGHLVSSCR